MQLIVEITNITDWDHFPGWVACRFYDAHGVEHVIAEKIPVVTDQNITPDSTFPRKGEVRCTLLGRWTDTAGRELVTVSTRIPDYVETIDGVFEFDVMASQIEE